MSEQAELSEGAKVAAALAVAERNDTEYVILELNTPGPLWKEAGKVTARSSETAVRAHAEKRANVESGGTFVAIPARSWKPVKVTPKTQTTLVFEDA